MTFLNQNMKIILQKTFVFLFDFKRNYNAYYGRKNEVERDLASDDVSDGTLLFTP